VALAAIVGADNDNGTFASKCVFRSSRSSCNGPKVDPALTWIK
jgi:hypothetical protein